MQDRVTAVPCKWVKKGQMTPSKPTGRGPQNSRGERQLVPYTGRAWLSATETGSQTGVQVGQLGLILSINQVFRGEIGLFLYLFFEHTMSKHSTCYKRGPNTVCLGTARNAQRHEKARLTLEVKGYLFPREFMGWSSLGVGQQKYFVLTLAFFLNANLPAPKNEKNQLFAHIRFIFEELSMWKSSILSRHTRELHLWGQICPCTRLRIWNSHKWLEANGCRNLAQWYSGQLLVGFPHHNLKFRWNVKFLSACFSGGLVFRHK